MSCQFLCNLAEEGVKVARWRAVIWCSRGKHRAAHVKIMGFVHRANGWSQERGKGSPNSVQQRLLRLSVRVSLSLTHWASVVLSQEWIYWIFLCRPGKGLTPRLGPDSYTIHRWSRIEVIEHTPQCQGQLLNSPKPQPGRQKRICKER